MPIDGVRTIEKHNYSIFYIDNFSDDFKQIIREQLQGIWNGFADVNEDIHNFYSYKNTLKYFFETYDSKEDNIKKGMIGELIAHILIPIYYTNFTSISILKNFEENQIKKGFDIIYYDHSNSYLWYSESKSGRSQTGINSTIYNTKLLYKSRSGLLEMINSGRNKLWDKARSEVEKTIETSRGRLEIKNLLTSDAPNIAAISNKKRAILISVLYHGLSDEINPEVVNRFQAKTHSKTFFEETIVISIQKEAFEAVELFLRNEITIA